MRRALNWVYTFSGWLAAACIALICLLVVAQVILNIIDRISTLTTGNALGLSIPSYADFTGFLLAAASFLALAWTLRQGGHIRVSLVTSHLPVGIQKIFDGLALAVAFAITSYFTWYMAALVWESWSYHDLSSGMVPIPLWIPQMPMLIGLFILSLALLDDLVAVIQRKKPSWEALEVNTLELDTKEEAL